LLNSVNSQSIGLSIKGGGGGGLLPYFQVHLDFIKKLFISDKIGEK
jgi:hypothetical protein